MKLKIADRPVIKPGLKFGRLTVVRLAAKKDSTGCLLWEVLCDCGNTDYAQKSHLLGTKKSCGCLRSEVSRSHCIKRKERLDITGQRFGILTAVEIVKHSEGHGYTWRTQCDCGNEKIITRANIYRAQSCGCLEIKKTKERREKVAKLFTPDIVNLLGTMPDVKIAKQIGTSELQVRNKRNALNIKPYANKPEIVFTEEMIRDLGKMPDTRFAKKYGVKYPSTVGRKRSKLGIEKYKP